MDYYPLWEGVMKWLFIIATYTCHRTFAAPALGQPHTQIKPHDKKQWQEEVTAFSFPSSMFTSPPLPSFLPRTNPFPMLSSPSSSHTKPELWVHSPLIHWQSYLSSGTIVTVLARLRTAACRKMPPLSQGCGTLCSRLRQPNSLSEIHIKSSLMACWEKKRKIPVPVCFTVFQMEFLSLQCNWRQWQMTNRISAWCRFVIVLIYHLLFCSFTNELRVLAVRAILLFM